jgi:molybdenum cofactor biosynthesis enzyme MoaA
MIELVTSVPISNAPPATAANNANIRAGLQQDDLGSPVRADEQRASARSYMPDGSRVTVIPSFDSEYHCSVCQEKHLRIH